MRKNLQSWNHPEIANKKITMKTIHELLVVLRANCRIRNGNVLLDGLCHEASRLNAIGLINSDELKLLNDYIYDNMPERPWTDKNGFTRQSLYGWPQCEWPPRLDWLNEHIESTKQQ